MKKPLIIFTSLLVLMGCSQKETTVKEESKVSSEVKEVEGTKEDLLQMKETVRFEEPFKVIFKNGPPNKSFLQEYTTTVSNFRIQKELKNQGDENNAKLDFILLDILVENTGDKELHKYSSAGNSSFEIYNQNGAKIETGTKLYSIEEATYELKTLRPGGSNEGTIVFEMAEGDTVSEIILNSDPLFMDENQYIFDLKGE